MGLLFVVAMKKILLFTTILMFSWLFPAPSSAEETYIAAPVLASTTAAYTEEEWRTRLQPDIAFFTIHDDGSASGMTVTGVPFTQLNIPNSFGIRMQKFEMGEHFHYIVEGVAVYTEEELQKTLREVLSATALQSDT